MRGRAVLVALAVGSSLALCAAAPQEWRPAADRYERRYPGLGPFEATRIERGGGRIELVVGAGERPGGREALRRWVERAATAIEGLYGRLPQPEVTVTALPAAGRRIGGMTWGGRFIRMRVGSEADEGDLERDWVLVHELIHTAFPDLPEEQAWMEEGLAVLVEPMLRARAGQLSEAEVWEEWIRCMPQGLPREGDGGLDGTRSWGRTYWGGALFWLMVDVETRERTGGRRSLRDLLLAVREAGADGRCRWDVAALHAVAERATGVPVLREMHGRYGPRPESVDLPALWRRLGVKAEGRTVSYDDRAPLARLRRSMLGD
jgi:hypothetical protein